MDTLQPNGAQNVGLDRGLDPEPRQSHKKREAYMRSLFQLTLRPFSFYLQVTRSSWFRQGQFFLVRCTCQILDSLLNGFVSSSVCCTWRFLSPSGRNLYLFLTSHFCLIHFITILTVKLLSCGGYDVHRISPQDLQSICFLSGTTVGCRSRAKWRVGRTVT